MTTTFPQEVVLTNFSILPKEQLPAGTGRPMYDEEFIQAYNNLALEASFHADPKGYVGELALDGSQQEAVCDSAADLIQVRADALKLLDRTGIEASVTDAQQFAHQLIAGVGDLCCNRFVGPSRVDNMHTYRPTWKSAYLLGEQSMGRNANGRPLRVTMAEIKEHMGPDGEVRSLSLHASERGGWERRHTHDLAVPLTETDPAVATFHSIDGGTWKASEGPILHGTLQFLAGRVGEAITLLTGKSMAVDDREAIGTLTSDIVRREHFAALR